MDRASGPPRDVWVHPALAVRASAIEGHGLFATAPIAADVLVMRLGGRLVSTEELHALFAETTDDRYIDTFAVGSDTHLVLPCDTAAHYGNHSCDPNAWLFGAYDVVTRRPIAAGEELTVDYGTISDDATFEMACSCGAVWCRGVITGEDWRRSELQRRYAGHWPPGLQQRISASLDPE